MVSRTRHVMCVARLFCLMASRKKYIRYITYVAHLFCLITSRTRYVTWLRSTLVSPHCICSATILPYCYMIGTPVLSHCFQNEVNYIWGPFVSLHDSKNEVYYASIALFFASWLQECSILYAHGSIFYLIWCQFVLSFLKTGFSSDRRKMKRFSVLKNNLLS